MTFSSFRILVCALALAVLALRPPGALANNKDIEAARAAAAAGKWETVIEKARNVLSRDPSSAEALGILGEAEIALGDTLIGMTHLKRALSFRPQDTRSLVTIVDVLLETGKMDEADRYVSSAEDKDRGGKLWEIKACRARVLAAEGDVPRAIPILAEAAVKNPTNPLYPKLLARLYRDKNIYALAIDHYRHAIAIEPANSELRFELAQVLLKNKQFDEAMAEFKTVRDAGLSNEEVNYQIGKLYFAAGRHAEAIEPLEAAVRDRPEHFLSHYVLGQAYRNLNRLAEAEAALRRAHALRPGHRDLTLMLARTLADEKRYAQEAAFLHSALGDTSTDADLLTMEGDAHYMIASQAADANFKLLESDSAASSYKQSLAAEPGQPKIAYRVATVYYNNDRLDSAIVYYKKTLKLQPDNCGAIINMGYSYGRLKKWTDAIAALRRGAVCDKTNVSARSYLASILAAQDSTGAAIVAYKEVAALDSANCDAYGQMGLIYFNREQYENAIRNLRLATSYCPGRGDYWSVYGYANWSQFLAIREAIRDSHDGLIPGDELWTKGQAYLEAARRGFDQALRYTPDDTDLKDTLKAVTDYIKRLGGR